MRLTVSVCTVVAFICRNYILKHFFKKNFMFKYVYMFLYNSVILLNLCIVRSLMLPSVIFPILALRRVWDSVSSFPSRLTGSINSKSSSVSVTSANMEHGKLWSITFKMFLQSGLASEDKDLCVYSVHPARTSYLKQSISKPHMYPLLWYLWVIERLRSLYLFLDAEWHSHIIKHLLERQILTSG